MKIFRNRMPKIWLSVIAMGVLFLGFAGATVKASDNQTGGFFGLTAVSEYLFGTEGGNSSLFNSAALVDTVQLSSATFTVVESAGFAQITVTRTDAAATTVTVNYATSNGSATGGTTCAAGVDYISTNGTLTFNPGVTSQTFVVPICNDSAFEGSETFNVDLLNPQGGTLLGTPASAIVTITDNDPTQPGTLQFSPTTYTVGENGGTATLTITRTGGSNGAVSASFTLNDGTAVGGASCTAGVDYINPAGAPDGTVTLANGQNNATITVQLCDDGVAEGQEAFTVTLSNPTGGATLGANSTATVTINDDEGNTPGVIQFNPTTYTVREGVGTVTLTVTRTGGTTGAVSASYVLSNGTATGGSSCTAGVDFINTGGTVTFVSGQTGTTATITVQICNDSVDEVDETFTATLVNPNGGVTIGANSTATVTIVDDENGVFQFNPTTYTVAENAGTVLVTVTRADAAGSGSLGTATIDYATSNGPTPNATGGTTCAAGIDYITQSGTLSFGPGVTTQSFTIQICDDAAFELNAENFTITLSNPTGGSVVGPNGTARVTITDNDTAQPGVFTIGATPNPVPEGTAVTITITRSGGTDTAVTVQNVTINGTATGGTTCTGSTGNVDYITDNFTNSFANSQTSGGTQTITFTIATCNDAVFEPNETFTVALQNPTGGSTLGTPSSVVITIVDNDAQPGTLNFNPTTYQVNESVGTATLTVTRTSGTDTAVSAAYTLGGGTATGGASCDTAGVDYINTGGTVNFASGQASATIAVPICNDTLDESAETFTATLSAPVGGVTLGPNTTATVTILDDEEGTAQFSTGNFTVNESAGTATITVNRTSNGGNIGTVSVDVTLSNGTATGGTACDAGVDYINPAGTPDATLTFGQGVTSQSFTVTICPDALDEPDETVNLTLSNAQNGVLIGTQSTAVLTITDDDATPTVSISNVTQAEGNAGTTNFVFNVNLSAASGQAVTVNFAVANGTATGGAACTAGVDFITPANGTLTFATGSTAAQQVTVQVCGDLNVESDETFFVNLSGATNSTLPANTQGVGTIQNDDGTPGTIGFGGPGIAAPGDVRVVEGNSGTTTAVVSVQLTGNPNAQNVTVNFTVTSASGGTATGGATCSAGVDYITPANGTLTFNAAGTTQQTFTIQICGDTVKEANEILFVNLSAVTGNATISDTQAVIIIVDDDKARVADFDRDRVTDFSVFRPSNGFWYILQSANNLPRQQQFGQAGDIITPGDYDNDGATDLAYYRPSLGTFFILGSSNNIAQSIQLGANGDIPVPGDYDGDGDTDPAVFRPSNGTFFTSTNPATNFGAIQFGQTGDIPVQGDYDGDGRTDVAVYRNGTWFVLRSTLGFLGIQYGAAGDRPVVGDFDGDGKIDFTVYRPSGNPGQPANAGVFFTYRSLTALTDPVNASRAVPFGASDDIPTSGDYDGDGTTDYSVWRPAAQAQFFFIRSSNNSFGAASWGTTGDIPVPSRYQATASTPTP